MMWEEVASQSVGSYSTGTIIHFHFILFNDLEKKTKNFIISLSLYNVAHKIVIRYTEVIDCDVEKIES